MPHFEVIWRRKTVQWIMLYNFVHFQSREQSAKKEVIISAVISSLSS